MDDLNDDTDKPRLRFRKRWVLWSCIGLWTAVGVWQTTKPMPAGTHVQSAPVAVDAASVQFLADLTYNDPRGHLIHEQQIFDEVFRMIDGAETFIVADFFLFNDFMGASDVAHRKLSRELATRLIDRHRAKPSLTVLLITDPINNVYGGAKSQLLDELRTAGINVVVT